MGRSCVLRVRHLLVSQWLLVETKGAELKELGKERERSIEVTTVSGIAEAEMSAPPPVSLGRTPGHVQGRSPGHSTAS